MTRGRSGARLAALVGLLALVVLVALASGTVAIAPLQLLAIAAGRVGLHVPAEVTAQQEQVLLVIRAPRVGLACVVGAALGCAGAAMQARSRTPLSDPALLGIGAAAALGAAVGRLAAVRLGIASEIAGTLLVAAAAVLPAWAASAAIHRVATVGGRIAPSVLLIGGVALSALLGALTIFVVFAGGGAATGEVTFWTLGSLAAARSDQLAVATLVVVPAVVVLARMAPGLDALALGERAATHLGVDVRAQGRLLVALMALLTAVAVAMVGVIAFLALVTPGLVRRILGPAHRGVTLGSAILGATLLVAADLVARLLLAPLELPLGAVTAIVGGPFLLWLLLRDRSLLAA